MTLILHELAAAEEDRRFSPYCWRTRMALAHKGLEAERVPWRFTDTGVIAPSGQGRVPVLVDDGRWLSDSWVIADHLEAAYPDRPSLFGGAVGRALAHFVGQWVEGVIHPRLFRMIACDVHAHLADRDKDYFRTSRERRIGMSLEAFAADRDTRREGFRRSLDPARAALAARPYLSGDAPAYADYVLFGAFQWARCISPYRILDADDPLHAWRARLLGLYDGLAGKALGYPC